MVRLALMTHDGSIEHPESPLKSWPRPHYEPGGGDAWLFYVVYGRVDTAAALSRSAYRSEGIPDGLKVMSYGPTVHPETVVSFQNGYLWDQLQETKPELAAQIGAQDSCIVLQGTFKDPRTLDYLRDTVGLITHFLDHGGVAVYDPQMFEWWSPHGWEERIFDPEGPVPRHHTVILVSEDGPATEWIHTRGLRKFGRPDLSIHRVPPSLKEGVVDLCNRFIELQAFGGVVAEEQEIRMKSLWTDAGTVTVFSPTLLSWTIMGMTEDEDYVFELTVTERGRSGPHCLDHETQKLS